MKILIAADGSSYTKRMLAYLAAHDEWLGPAHAYTVLTVTAPLPPRAVAVLDKELVKSYQAEEAEKVFKPIRAFFGKRGMQAEFVAKTGHAAEVIAKLADSGRHDLLVMGSHGHSALGTLVMGSVTNKVLAQCRTPVLLVR
ncbi:universal stress protein [Piscinibacter sakaiensis]|uniref:Universal stress family protein n=1 Tax=Piscinibacter sakaiensis TaxID=1547922 RepID=A0A0K8P4M1_PISS1|nr:universal stress protein [Piscinibacter sakaiensis]GAP37623.1 universal stress family protein [Piscinibacter sakaiensis]